MDPDICNGKKNVGIQNGGTWEISEIPYTARVTNSELR